MRAFLEPLAVAITRELRRRGVSVRGRVQGPLDAVRSVELLLEGGTARLVR